MWVLACLTAEESGGGATCVRLEFSCNVKGESLRNEACPSARADDAFAPFGPVLAWTTPERHLVSSDVIE